MHIMAGRSSYHARGTGSDLAVTDNGEEPVVDAGEFESVPVVGVHDRHHAYLQHDVSTPQMVNKEWLIVFSFASIGIFER